jgi:phosphoribosyl-ATP pyrophosphohydrolase
MASAEILERLYRIVEERRNGDPERSYIAKRFTQGREKIVQKFGEEAVETVIAAIAEDRQGIVNESADFLFHWLMLLVEAGVSVDEIMAELEKREGTSGLDEKAARKLQGKA